MISDYEIKHIKDNRIYPRPRAKCDGCGNDIHFCCGDKIKPYWAHLSNTNNKCGNPSSESASHKIAKEILIYYYEKNNIVNYKIKCNNCKNSKLYMTNIEDCTYFKKEYSDIKIRKWDIAAISKNNNIIYGIEIYTTHKAEVLNRNDIIWFEVSSEDVINAISYNEDEIYLDCINKLCCDDCKSSKILCPGDGSCILHGSKRKYYVNYNYNEKYIHNGEICKLI
jgi:hypothetical protein